MLWISLKLVSLGSSRDAGVQYVSGGWLDEHFTLTGQCGNSFGKLCEIGSPELSWHADFGWLKLFIQTRALQNICLGLPLPSHLHSPRGGPIAKTIGTVSDSEKGP